MPVTAWRAAVDDKEFGVDENGVTPAAFAAIIAQHEGEELVTYYRKPYVLRASDPQSVYDYFDSEIDPHGDRATTRWEYTPDEADSSDVTP